MLRVPFFVQHDESSCGAAAMQMAFHHLRPNSNLNPKRLFEKLRQISPVGSTEVSINALEEEAIARGLAADWGIFSNEPARLKKQLSHFTDVEEVPVVALQQLSDTEPVLGHYRIVIGVDGDTIFYHDPISRLGRATSVSVDRFIEMWRPSGGSVKGGIGLWMSKKPIERTDILPTRLIKHLWPKE